VVRLHDTTYQLEIADSEKARAKGLSGRRSIDTKSAMLFVFPTPQKACFWMKDMHFSIDIVWLDEQKRVSKLLSGASPGSYPTSYCSDTTTKYVLEFPAGTIKQQGIQQGQKLDF